MNTTTTFQPNDMLMLEVGTEHCFVGQLVFQNASGTKLELDNVRNWHTDEPLHGVQIFYRNEIRSVRLLPVTTDSNADGTSSEDSATRAPTTAEPVLQSKSTSPPAPIAADTTTSVLSVDQLDRIQAACMAPVYHPQADHGYLTAIGRLQRMGTVAVSVACVYRASHSVVGLIALMGAHQDDDGAAVVHIFDVVSMGGIPVELRQLLAARRPRKIVHDSSLVAYVLLRVYNVHIDGVFDTRMAHSAISGATGFCRLGTLVQMYLHIPEGSVPDAGPVNWTERPLAVEQRLIAGRQVAYLPALYEHLLFERMMGYFYENCKRFAHAYTCGLDEMDEAFNVSQLEDIRPELESQPLVQRQDVPQLPRLEELEI